MEIFCFALGVWYGLINSWYLPLAACLLFFLTPTLRLLLFWGLGFLLSSLHQYLTPQPLLPDKPVIARATLQGTVASLPREYPHKRQFIVSLEQVDGHSSAGLIQLTWYNQEGHIHPGERWQFTVKLKKPRNYRNPGGFNYELSLAKQHIHWVGYILPKTPTLLLEKPHKTSWLTLRDRLASKMAEGAPDLQTAAIVQALSLNIAHHISPELWELFRRTGTIHLFGISGEHIALIAGLVFALVHRLWGFYARGCLRVPALKIASIAGLITAFLYALLAGFEPPVQRALVGCGFYTLLCLGKQGFTPWQVWRYALITVLCLEPHAVFMQGFHFSFLAVACLLLTAQRWRLSGVKAKMAEQMSCLWGLMPLSLYWFDYGSINGFLANAFAIPLVGFLIVPLSLLSLLACNQSWHTVLMYPLSWLIHVLIGGLQIVEGLSLINVTFAIPAIEGVLCLLAALLLLVVLPLKPFKAVACLWLLLPWIPNQRVQPNEALISVLDVGQGLAVVVQTQNHTLLYDTGDKFFQGRDLASMVILPYLRSLHISKIDRLVISHPDRDHRGGLESMEQNMTIASLLVNDRNYYSHGEVCHNSPDWEWEGIHFHFFAITDHFLEKNNSSCVLRVSNPKHSLLLTGDIEKPAEDYLVRQYGQRLSSDSLILPHHGSKTSSSPGFIQTLKPAFAVVSLGFDNRFHFPHVKTLTTLQAQRIPLYRTDSCGMLQWLLPAKGKLQPPLCEARAP